MDAYLVNNGKGFSLLYNRSAAQETGKRQDEGALTAFARNFPLYNLLMLTARWSEAVIRSSNGELLSAGCGLVLHYADTMSESEARNGFESIVKREMRRLGTVAAANIALIPVSVVTPLVLVPMSSTLFGIAAYQSLRIRRAVKKCAGKAGFVPDKAVSELEKKVLGGGKSAEDCFSEYDFT